MATAPQKSVCPPLIEEAFRDFAGGSAHPCLGARSVVHRDAYDLKVYATLGSRAVAGPLSEDLERFATTVGPETLSSFVASFQAPAAMTEASFRTLLWRQLQYLHDRDRTRFAWDRRVSSDPASPNFSFSVAGRAFFVIGMHPDSSRQARRFAWPTLVFNPHEQFVGLREAGKYDRLRTMIRARDLDLQGSVNPMLRDHGQLSEARQYAGDAVAEGWRCPLEVRLS